MFKEQGFWVLLCTGLVVVCGYNIMEKRSIQNKMAVSGTASEVDRQDALLYQQGVYSHAGRMIQWPDTLEAMNEVVPEPEAFGGYRLVLAFSELSCDVCRDEETRFAMSLAQEVGPEAVTVVVHANNRRYANAYMRLNSVTLPVLYDESGTFFEKNNLRKTPVSLLLNERNEVIAASVPLTGKPWLNEPFHKLCRKFLAKRKAEYAGEF